MKCKRCGGSGLEPDHKAVGRQMRDKRERANISLSEMARRLGFSKAYVSDLELGRRGWHTAVKKAYGAALQD